MAEAKKETKKARTFRFEPVEKVFYNGRLYRAKNTQGYPDYLEVSVPLAPNHHFMPVGEVVASRGDFKVEDSQEMQDAFELLRTVESDMKFCGERDFVLKSKVIWPDAFGKLVESETNDPKAVLSLVKDLDKKWQEQKKGIKAEVK